MRALIGVRFKSRLLLVMALGLASALGTAAPVAASASAGEAESVIAVASDQLGDRFLFSATGPNQFDCSGLVYYSFREADLLDRIGGKRRTVAGYYKWFNARGLVSRSNPRLGDLVVWGRNKHMGIYVGDGMAISAVINPYGVKVHKVNGWLNLKFKAYLHVGLD